MERVPTLQRSQSYFEQITSAGLEDSLKLLATGTEKPSGPFPGPAFQTFPGWSGTEQRPRWATRRTACSARAHAGAPWRPHAESGGALPAFSDFQTLEAGKPGVTNKRTRAAVHAAAPLRVLSVARSHMQRSGPG